MYFVISLFVIVFTLVKLISLKYYARFVAYYDPLEIGNPNITMLLYVAMCIIACAFTLLLWPVTLTLFWLYD